MTETDWLAQVKVGDTVVIDSGYGIRELTLGVVTSSTPTQIRINTTKYRRADGRMMGDQGWRSYYLREPTNDRLYKIRRRVAVERLQATRWADCSDDVIFAAVKLLRQAEQAKESQPEPAEASRS